MFASAGKSIHIYSLERGGLKSVSKYSPKPSVSIKHMSWCHDNSYIAILQENEFPQIISTKDPGCLSLVHTISSVPEVTALKFKSDTKRLLALGTRDGEVMLYDTKKRCISKLLGQLASEITCLEFNSANELAAISSEVLVVFNLTDSNKMTVSNPDECTVLKCLNKNTGQTVVGCVNGMVVVWDVVSGREVKTYRLHSAPITGIAVSNKNKLMVTTGADNKICFIDNSTQKCIFKKVLHQPITSIDTSANDQHMVVGLKDGSICVYHMNDHLKPQVCSKMHPSAINQIAFVNGISLDLLESDSILEEENNCEMMNTTTKDKDFSVQTTTEQVSSEELLTNFKTTEFSPEPLPIETAVPEDVDVSEEKVKLDLIKLVNGHFSHLEEQLVDHCGRLQTLVSTELDSLYALAARWECFKTMEMDEIVRYICGVVSAASETKISSEKSTTHSNND